ncbi:secreted effector J (pseudogene), partial [Salmonella enterica subsp. enterica serovar Typhi str. CT18]
VPGAKDPQLDICPQYVFNDFVHPTQEVHHCFATMLESFIAHHYSTE